VALLFTRTRDRSVAPDPHVRKLVSELSIHDWEVTCPGIHPANIRPNRQNGCSEGSNSTALQHPDQRKWNSFVPPSISHAEGRWFETRRDHRQSIQVRGLIWRSIAIWPPRTRARVRRPSAADRAYFSAATGGAKPMVVDGSLLRPDSLAGLLELLADSADNRPQPVDRRRGGPAIVGVDRRCRGTTRPLEHRRAA
jgi:hypothetical protein